MAEKALVLFSGGVDSTTCLDYAYEADTWMPDLNREDGWELAERGEEQTCFDLIYYFTTYKNTACKKF